MILQLLHAVVKTALAAFGRVVGALVVVILEHSQLGQTVGLDLVDFIMVARRGELLGVSDCPASVKRGISTAAKSQGG